MMIGNITEKYGIIEDGTKIGEINRRKYKKRYKISLYPLIKTTSALQRIFKNGYKEAKNTLYRCNADVA